MSWAHENMTPVAGATRHSDVSSAVWERVEGHYACQALTGAWAWRAMVVDIETKAIAYITPHQFADPNEAMDDALRFAKAALWDDSRNVEGT